MGGRTGARRRRPAASSAGRPPRGAGSGTRAAPTSASRAASADDVRLSGTIRADPRPDRGPRGSGGKRDRGQLRLARQQIGGPPPFQRVQVRGVGGLAPGETSPPSGRPGALRLSFAAYRRLLVCQTVELDGTRVGDADQRGPQGVSRRDDGDAPHPDRLERLRPSASKASSSPPPRAAICSAAPQPAGVHRQEGRAADEQLRAHPLGRGPARTPVASTSRHQRRSARHSSPGPARPAQRAGGRAGQGREVRRPADLAAHAPTCPAPPRRAAGPPTPRGSRCPGPNRCRASRTAAPATAQVAGGRRVHGDPSGPPHGISVSGQRTRRRGAGVPPRRARERAARLVRAPGDVAPRRGVARRQGSRARRRAPGRGPRARRACPTTSATSNQPASARSARRRPAAVASPRARAGARAPTRPRPAPRRPGRRPGRHGRWP